MSSPAIRTKAEQVVASVVGSTFKRLSFHDLALNDDRELQSGYSVQFGQASQIYEIHQATNEEQTISITITKKSNIRNDDSKANDALGTLYGFADTIVDRFVVDKLDIPETVYLARHTGTSDPIRVGEGRDILALTMSFQVKYVI